MAWVWAVPVRGEAEVEDDTDENVIHARLWGIAMDLVLSGCIAWAFGWP